LKSNFALNIKNQDGLAWFGHLADQRRKECSKTTETRKGEREWTEAALGNKELKADRNG
jgi:hypothetical protein